MGRLLNSNVKMKKHVFAKKIKLNEIILPLHMQNFRNEILIFKRKITPPPSPHTLLAICTLNLYIVFHGNIAKYQILFPFYNPFNFSKHDYFWNVHTNQVSWRHPNDPKAQITYPASWQKAGKYPPASQLFSTKIFHF